MRIEFDFFASDEPNLVQALHLGLDESCGGRDPSLGAEGRWLETADVRRSSDVHEGGANELPTRENIRDVVAGSRCVVVAMREGAPVAKHGNHLEGVQFWVCNVDIERGIARMILADPRAWAGVMEGDFPTKFGLALWKHILLGRDEAIRIEG